MNMKKWDGQVGNIIKVIILVVLIIIGKCISGFAKNFNIFVAESLWLIMILLAVYLGSNIKLINMIEKIKNKDNEVKKIIREKEKKSNKKLKEKDKWLKIKDEKLNKTIKEKDKKLSKELKEKDLVIREKSQQLSLMVKERDRYADNESILKLKIKKRNEKIDDLVRNVEKINEETQKLFNGLNLDEEEKERSISINNYIEEIENELKQLQGVDSTNTPVPKS